MGTSQSTVFELAASAAFYLLRGASGLRAESCPVWHTGICCNLSEEKRDG